MENFIKMVIDSDPLVTELNRLAEFSDVPSPAVTRIMLSDSDLAARKYLCGLFQSAGLEVRTDPAGNLFARWVGTEPDLPAVGTGSHCDAIPHSGKYDGTVGVLGGLAAVRAMQKAGLRPRRSIDLVMFTSEEPTRYGVGCLGSRLLSGQLDPSDADQLVDSEEKTFATLRKETNLRGSLGDVPLPGDAYVAFVELHTEQGPLLEQKNIDIGVVTHIAAPSALRVSYQGVGGHAGTVLMEGRRDALLPAAKLVVAVDRAARDLGSKDTVATTGLLEVYPGAVNSIPRRTQLEIDIRDIALDRRDLVLAHIAREAQSLGEEHQQKTVVEQINADPPATCADLVVQAIEEACETAGVSHQRMISRAYHDSLFMAQVCPTGMIFIPCREGVSHHPDEFASPDALGNGALVLAHTLCQLAEAKPTRPKGKGSNV